MYMYAIELRVATVSVCHICSAGPCPRVSLYMSGLVSVLPPQGLWVGCWYVSIEAMACPWGLGHVGEGGRLGGHGQGPGHMCESWGVVGQHGWAAHRGQVACTMRGRDV